MKLNNKGITLIELMIIVAIIGLLAAIAVPQFARLIGIDQVNTERHKHGLPALTREQFDKMYPDGYKPGIKPVESTDTTDPNSSDHFHSRDNLKVTCFAKIVDGKLLVDVGSCHQ